MTAGLLADSVVTIIATVTIGGLAVGLVMLGATWGPRVGRDQQIVQGGLDVDRIRCPACGGVKFRGEFHNCPKAAPTRQVQPIRVDVHFNSPARRPTTRADYDRPPPPPPPIPIETKARS